MIWLKKLNKKELKHLKETMERISLASFKRNREYQKTYPSEDGYDGCMECKKIAIKLGIE